jgi:hypothetical protein
MLRFYVRYCVFSESQGDKEISISPWEEVSQGVGFTRTIRFTAKLEVGWSP